ncbi:MAG: hypothetical protein L0Y42_01285 [Phycisphaerales bacterium]|nr:hypothetical protein [Phycisphaerales bacterium]
MPTHFIGSSNLTSGHSERHSKPPEQSSGQLLVALRGMCSRKAMANFLGELRPLVASHFRSVSLLETARSWDSISAERPCMTASSFMHHLEFTTAGIELAIMSASRGDTFDRRIANAVRLLAEADAQRNDAIRISLAVAAIDALLGRKGQEGAYKLADYVAAFLEPDVESRRKAADYVLDLYDKRSRVLHGEQLEGTYELGADSRILAACLLYAVWAYQDGLSRVFETSEKPDAMFEKLRADFVKPGQPIKLSDLPARRLWLTRAQ